MLETNEEKILQNTRMACVQSYFMPVTIGCIVCSAVYGTAHQVFFQFFWLGLGIVSFIKMRKELKTIAKEVK